MENKQEKISMRDALWNRIYELAEENKDIIIVSADMGAPALDKFRRDFPGQFVNTGIAEANTILIATGLALEGKKAFAFAIAPFITLRCYEEIKVELAAMNIPVTVVGVGAGVSYEDAGPTHHTTEDISIMRVLPNMTVNNPTDSIMAAAFADISCKMKGPNYLRLDRKVLPQIYQGGTDFSAGISLLEKSDDLYLVATGNMVHRALEVAQELKNFSIEAGVIDVYTFPINEKVFIEEIANAKRIVTLEEHILPGGLGSAVAEVLADNKKLLPLKRIGFDFRKGYCYKYGGRNNIQALYGLDKESIVRKILKLK